MVDAEDAGLGATLDDFLNEELPRDASSVWSYGLPSPPGLDDDLGPLNAFGPDDYRVPGVPTVDQDFGWNEPDRAPPVWRCLQCDRSVYAERGPAAWTCLVCGYDQFYDGRAPTRRESSQGVWMYVTFLRRRGREPDDGGSEVSWLEARAESEAPTGDVTVDPDTLQPAPRLSRRQRRAAAAAASGRLPPDLCASGVRLPAPRLGQGRRSADCEPPGALVADDQPEGDRWAHRPPGSLESSQHREKASTASEWNSRKGPEKGVKFAMTCAPTTDGKRRCAFGSCRWPATCRRTKRPWPFM